MRYEIYDMMIYDIYDMDMMYDMIYDIYLTAIG
jgi:hypothetical protein